MSKSATVTVSHRTKTLSNCRTTTQCLFIILCDSIEAYLQQRKSTKEKESDAGELRSASERVGGMFGTTRAKAREKIDAAGGDVMKAGKTLHESLLKEALRDAQDEQARTPAEVDAASDPDMNVAGDERTARRARRAGAAEDRATTSSHDGDGSSSSSSNGATGEQKSSDGDGGSLQAKLAWKPSFP